MALRLDGGTGIIADNIADGAITAAKISSDARTPAGVIGYFGTSSAPTGWLKCNGAAISRTTYSDLFAEIGTTFGTGDGSTTFNVPDLRGEFIRSLDDGAGVDSARGLGTTQAAAVESHQHDVPSNRFWVTGTIGGDGTIDASHIVSANDRTVATDAVQAYGGTETRPRNLALLACIKY